MKRMLLLGMGFFNFEDIMKKGFENEGYYVDYVKDSPECIGSMNRFIPDTIWNSILLKYYHKIEKMCDESCYDFVLVIVGRNIPYTSLKRIRESNTNTKLFLYLWDQVSLVSNFEQNRELYDVILSFDTVDCRKYHLDFCPLFFTNEYDCIYCENTYDVYTAMTDLDNRNIYIRKFAKKYSKKKLELHLKIGRINYIKNVLSSVLKKDDLDIHYSYKSYPKEKNILMLEKSFATLEFVSSDQSGLSARTFEAIEAGTKLITNNSFIKEYDLYNENNIVVIDDNMFISNEFWSNPFVPVDEEIKKKYSLKNWVRNILKYSVSVESVNDNAYNLHI